MHLKITPHEQEIFQFLIEFKHAINSDVEIRVVGGWVRDKILQVENDDIDIMLYKMTVSDFIQKITETYPAIKTFKVKENPDASKHLETGRVFFVTKDGSEYPIDIAMARKEVYDSNGRIPSSISKATPKEDAFRRDFTINALFYNIETKEIEDFTGRGIFHLTNNPGKIVIETPNNPYITFKEDPLRILRGIRFVAKYNGKFSERIESTIPNEYLFEALNQKVSRERINEELYKVLDKKYFNHYLLYLEKYGFFNFMLENLDIDSNLNYFDVLRIPSLENNVKFNLLKMILVLIREQKNDQDYFKENAIKILNYFKISKKEQNYCLNILSIALYNYEPFRLPTPYQFNKMVCECYNKNLNIEDLNVVLRFFIFGSLCQQDFANMDKYFKKAKDRMEIIEYNSLVDGTEIMNIFPELEPKSIGKYKEQAFEYSLQNTEYSKCEIIEKLKLRHKER